MKKSLIISAAAAAAILAGGGAKAADIVTYQQQPIAPAAVPETIDWTGLYVGGTLGGSWADAGTRLRHEDSEGGYGRGKIVGAGNSPSSFMGGLYTGYNFQIPMINNSANFMKSVVFGVETDWLFNSGTGEGHRKFNATSKGDDYADFTEEHMQDPAGYLYNSSVRQKWNGSTRLRIGMPVGPQGRFLPYFAAGVSYADIRTKGQIRTYGRDDGGNLTNLWSASKTKTRAGWNVGVGVDYVPPIMNDHLVLRAEYRYTDFGKESYRWDGGTRSDGVDGASYTRKMIQSNKYYQNDFRLGVAYKF